MVVVLVVVVLIVVVLVDLWGRFSILSQRIFFMTTTLPLLLMPLLVFCINTRVAGGCSINSTLAGKDEQVI